MHLSHKRNFTLLLINARVLPKKHDDFIHFQWVSNNNPKKCLKIEHIEEAILFPSILKSIPKSSIMLDYSQRLTITEYVIYRMKTHRRSNMAHHHCTCIEHISILYYIDIISFNIYLLQRAKLEVKFFGNQKLRISPPLYIITSCKHNIKSKIDSTHRILKYTINLLFGIDIKKLFTRINIKYGTCSD